MNNHYYFKLFIIATFLYKNLLLLHNIFSEELCEQLKSFCVKISKNIYEIKGGLTILIG